MGMQVVNPATGDVLELQGSRWVPVGKAAGATTEGPSTPSAAAGTPMEPASGNALNAALVGAGDTLTTWGRNVRDAYAGLTGDRAAQLAIADERVDADKYRAQLFAEHPVSAMLGSAVPGIVATLPLAGVGAGAGAANLAARVGTNLGTGAVMGALGSTSGQLGEDAVGGGLWSAGGMLAGNMIARVNAARAGIRDARAAQEAERIRAMMAAGGEEGAAAGGAAAPALNDAERAIVEGAQRAGMQVTPGQMMNDASMRQMEASFASNPVLSPYWQELKRQNAQQINTLAARAMGVEADNVGPLVRAEAEDQIGRTFRKVGNDLGEIPTAGLHGELVQLAAEEATGGLPTREAWGVLKRFETGVQGRANAVAGDATQEGMAVKDLVKTDTIAGGDLIKMRSQVARDMRDAFAANRSDKGEVLGNVLNAIDDTIEQQALKTGKAGLVDQYDRAREQWSVLRALDRGAATADGQVIAGQLAAKMKQSDKTGFWGRAAEDGSTTLRGGTGQVGQDPLGDLYDAVRFANSRIGKDIVGDSGTATRLTSSGIFEGTIPEIAGRAAGFVARRALLGPLATRYMGMSPQAAQALTSAYQRSAMAGWQAGNAAGAAAGIGAGTLANEAGQALQGGQQP